MRKFPYITVGKILEELNNPVTRVTFYRLEKRLHFPPGRKTSGKLRWRVYSRSEANIIKRKIIREYNLPV